MPFVKVTVAKSAPEMDRLRPLWEHLLAHQSHSVFQQFSWNRLAAAIFRDRMTPLVVAVEYASGSAIIPAAIHHETNQVELLGESLFDYRDVLHAGDPEALRIAWQQVADTGLPLQVTALEREGARKRWQDFPVHRFARAPEVTGISEPEFRAAHSRLGRQYRRLQKQGVGLYISSGGDSGLVRHLYECKAEQFPNDAGNLFCDPLRHEFMVAVAALEGKCCEVFTLQDNDGLLVAGLVTFLEERVRRFYTVYFNPTWAYYSPGVALLYEATARCLGQGLRCDYMTGEYPYKLRLSNSSRQLCEAALSASELAEVAYGALASRAA